jgi:hypothetical protein
MALDIYLVQVSCWVLALAALDRLLGTVELTPGFSGLGAWVTLGCGVGMLVQHGTRQHRSLGSVARMQPIGTLVYWAHLKKT